MRDWLRKLDIAGLLILIAVLLLWRIGGVWTAGLTGAAVAGGAAVLGGMFFRRDEIGSAISSRSTRFGANSVTSVLLLLGILAIVNYLAVRNEARWDLTTERRHTLAEQSTEVLDLLGDDVHILAFYADEDPAVANLLDLYDAASPGISWEFVDPDAEPQRAGRYDVTVYGSGGNPFTGQSYNAGTLILEMGERRERIESETTPLAEEDVTNALVALAKGEVKAIYFVEGHGEKQIDDTERTGLDAARGALERENYRVEGLNLVRAESMPEDAAVLVWAGPQVEPFAEEVARVAAWLDAGGAALVLLDPPPAGAAMDALLAGWSVAAGEDFVVDVSGIGQLLGAGPEIPVVSDYAAHPITEDFGLMTIFPMVRSLRTEPGDPGLTVTAFLSTSARSWGETELDSTEVGFGEGEDTPGPVTIGVALERAAAEDGAARLVVVGDSDFATNAFFGLQGNGDLFLNAVRWLAADEDFIAIRPKEPQDRPLTLTESQARTSFYVSMILFPLAILVAGVTVWVRRRKL